MCLYPGPAPCARPGKMLPAEGHVFFNTKVAQKSLFLKFFIFSHANKSFLSLFSRHDISGCGLLIAAVSLRRLIKARLRTERQPGLFHMHH